MASHLCGLSTAQRAVYGEGCHHGSHIGNRSPAQAQRKLHATTATPDATRRSPWSPSSLAIQLLLVVFSWGIVPVGFLNRAFAILYVLSLSALRPFNRSGPVSLVLGIVGILDSTTQAIQLFLNH